MKPNINSNEYFKHKFDDNDLERKKIAIGLQLVYKSKKI